MSEEIKEIHIKTYDEWLKYYENATKEQVIEDLTRDVQYFADAVKDIKDLQQKVEQLENIIDVKKYDYDYLEALFSKSSKEEVLKAYTYKCEQLEKVMKSQDEFEMKSMQLENIRKEAIEYIEGFYYPDERQLTHEFDGWNLAKLYDILNKGSNKDE